MPKTRLLTEFGIGSSLRHRDYTAAARRALQDALWRNSINLAELFGQPKEAMIIDVEIAALVTLAAAELAAVRMICLLAFMCDLIIPTFAPLP